MTEDTDGTVTGKKGTKITNAGGGSGGVLIDGREENNNGTFSNNGGPAAARRKRRPVFLSHLWVECGDSTCLYDLFSDGEKQGQKRRQDQ